MSNKFLSESGWKSGFLSAFAILGYAALGHGASISYQQGVSPDGSYFSADTLIRGDGGNASENYGAGPYLIVGNVPNGPLRGLLGFALSDIPAGSTITSVSLTIVGERNDTGSTDDEFTYFLHPLTGSFEEGVGDVSGNSGDGATWNNRETGTAWTTAGGTYDSETVLSDLELNVRSGVTDTAFTFDSTPEWVAAAQLALDSGVPLNMLLKIEDDGEASGDRIVFFFHSDDASGENLEDVGRRPILTIEYIPEPSVAALAGLALGAGVFRRRRK